MDEAFAGLGVLRNLIDSSAHHSEREMIVTHGRFQSEAKLILTKTNHIKIREKTQILLKIFINISYYIKYVSNVYKFLDNKCK